MARDPRYDILFESVRIGPVTAKNRFYQVPHADGMGYRDPSALAAMRGVKAEGGWAVVASGETEIHPTSEATPYVEGRMWDAGDIPAHRLVVDAIHATALSPRSNSPMRGSQRPISTPEPHRSAPGISPSPDAMRPSRPGR